MKLGSEGLLRAKIFLPVLAAAILAVLLAVAGLAWATSQSDRISVDRQIRTTQRAIDTSLQYLAREQEVVAVWDDPIQKLRQPNVDWAWFDDNFGMWLHQIFAHDRVYILNARDEAVYAVVDGKRVPARDYDAVRPDLKRLLDVVRGRLREPNHRHDRNPGQKRRSADGVLTTEKAVHDTHLLRVAGEPAAASVMLMAPLSDGLDQEPGSEFVTISVRFLDRDFLRSLASTNLIANPRLAANDQSRSGEESLALRSAHGDLLGFFIWTPELPGSRILGALGPGAALLLAAMFTMLAWLARSLLRTVQLLRGEIVSRELAEQRAAALARHDSLTGLANRRVFVEELETQLAARGNTNGGLVLIADVDGMRHINDLTGFQAADELLIQLAEELSAQVDGRGLVSRIGTDEFAVFVQSDQVGDLAVFAESLCARLQGPRILGKLSIDVRVTLGGALLPKDGITAPDLLHCADAALMRGKREGQGACTFFDPAMDEPAGAGVPRDAAKAAGRKPGLAAIDRMEAAVRTACSRSAHLPEETRICLSVAAEQLNDPWFGPRLLAVLNSVGTPPSRVIAEIVGADPSLSSRTVSDNLKELRAAGLGLAMVAEDGRSQFGASLFPDQVRFDLADQVEAIDPAGDQRASRVASRR